jgi:hypothetical protein
LKYRIKTCKSEDTSLKKTLYIVCWIVFRTRLKPKRYVERGRSYIRRKVWLSDALFTFFEYIVYSMVWLVYIVRVCLVYNIICGYFTSFDFIELFKRIFLVVLSYFYCKYSRSTVIFKLPVIYVGNQIIRSYMSILTLHYNESY